MKRSVDRILTTHVGSIPRPPSLMAVIDGAAKGEASAADVEKATAAAVVQVVKEQVEHGLDIVNDGEFCKTNWANYFLPRVSGYEHRDDQRTPMVWLGRDRFRFREVIEQDMPHAKMGQATEACVSDIVYTDRKPIEQNVADLKAALKGVKFEEAFLTAVAPASAAYNGINEHYSSDHDYIYALAEALRVEYQAIHDAGFVVQVDDAVLANMYDHLVQQSPQRYREWAQLRVDALNHALRGIPEDRIRYHVCFGSWHVPHVADAELESIADLILQVNAGAYSIEAANPRHEHEWRVWEKHKLPNNRILIPGVITHHTITVEHPRLVADRIIRFAKIVGKENVIAGCDCGFAQASFVKRQQPTVMWAKFDALRAGADLATKELWGK
jgi:5-methyltetrahydropteroyltriglutamate--homocysteine methyltransferase